MKNKKILGIIPARFASTRFPGKPLVEIWGKTMIQRVYEQCDKSKLFDDLVIATDDKRIEEEVMRFGGKVVQTHANHQSGTDRCAEVLANISELYDVVVNIQGDEPFVHANDLKMLIQSFDNDWVDISTLAASITESSELFDANKVKVVLGANQQALYFSRATIPYVRGEETENWMDKHTFYKHLGVYAYKSSVLKKVTTLPMGKLELLENLEQLRWLEAGYTISVQLTENKVIAVDTPEDLKKILENDALKSLES